MEMNKGEQQQFMDAFYLYVEDLRYKGVPVDDYDDNSKMKWYFKYMDNLAVDDYINKDKLDEIKVDLKLSTTDILVDQLKDDFQDMIGQVQLLTQRMERLEDRNKSMDKLVLNSFKRGK
jgi:hypothetical protein